MPKGQFAGNSTYGENYLNTGKAEKNPQYRPGNNLNIDRNAHFEGKGSYALDFDENVHGQRKIDKNGDLIYRH